MSALTYAVRGILALACILLPIATNIAFAQQARTWSPLDTEDGIGTGICDNPSGGSVCLRLQCGRNRGTEISIFSNYNALGSARAASILVDGEEAAHLVWQGKQPHITFNPVTHGPLLERLKAGRQAAIATNGKTFSLSLSGSSKEIDRTLAACEMKERIFALGPDTFGGRSERYGDEATMSFPPDGSTYQWSFTPYSHTDIWGNDIRSGVDDPLLQSMSKQQCETLCSLTQDCLYFTHNGRTNTCFLKSGVGRVERFQGATTGEFKGTRINLYPPPTRGGGTVVDPSLSWQDDDTAAEWLKRVRQSARGVAGPCDVESAVMQQMAADFEIALPHEAALNVGTGAKVEWSGNGLEERVPLWLVVAADKPVRFKGKGFFALGPEAANPFGLDTGAGRHRALVALYSRGAGLAGDFVIEPLAAGKVALEASLVGYLRGCEEEIVLHKQAATLNAVPGAARLVLNNDTGRQAYDHQITVEKWGRRILFNNTRLLVLNDSDGSEVVERAGSKLSLSPTHRFAAVNHDGKLEIIDLIDGETVARLSNGQLYWANGDSFLVTTDAPWGSLSIHSTFWDGLRLDDQVTGPSCCPATPEATRISIDLENAAIAVWDNLGWYIGALQNPAYSIGENTGSGYASDQTGHDAIYHHALNSIGSVSPVSLARHWVASGPLTETANWGDLYEGEAYDPERERADEEIAQLRLERVGLSAHRLENRFDQMATSSPTPDAVTNLLGRIGIDLAVHEDGEAIIDRLIRLNRFETGISVEDRSQRADEAMGSLRQEALSHGWQLEWTKPHGNMLDECDHIVVGQSGDHDNLPGNYAPKDVVEVNRINLADGNVWLARSDCQAGATFGSLRGVSGLYIYDFGRPYSGSVEQIEAATNSYLVNNRRLSFFESPLRVKAAGPYLLVYAPENGMIAVYDRDKRMFVWTGEGLADGDLLQDAFLSADLRHAVQINSDGGLHVYRVADGKHLLGGRIVDDELAIWLDDFRFDATAEAATLVDLRFAGKPGQYSLDRFGPAQRVSGLAALVLAGQDVPSADEAGIPPDISGTVRLRDDGRIDIAIEHATEGVTGIAVFQDGVLTGNHDFSGTTATATLSVERMKGARWLAAVASDGMGLVSLPLIHDLGEPAIKTAINRALVVGINTYDDPAIPSLNFALRDGGRFAETLASLPDGAASFDAIDYLKDTAATPEAILAGIEKLLAGLAKGDHAVLFFAGHGFRSSDGEFHFGTSSTNLADIDTTALAFSRISALLEGTEARITIVLDACHAGATNNSAFATNDDVVIDLARLKSNITILAASKGREFSQESAELGGGVFTHALAQVLAQDRALHDTNGNGRIEASELYLGVKLLVVSQRQGLQTPWMVRSRMVGDYALF